MCSRNLKHSRDSFIVHHRCAQTQKSGAAYFDRVVQFTVVLIVVPEISLNGCLACA